MNMDTPHSQPERQPDDRRVRKATVAAWCIILLALSLAVGARSFRSRPEADDGQLGGTLLELQGKYLVGAANLLGQGDPQSRELLGTQLKAWKPDAPAQQMRVAILAGEIVGPEEALQRLQAGERPPQRVTSTTDGDALRDILIRLYQDYTQQQWSGPAVSQPERQQLQDQFGWFGSLALAPPQTEDPLRERIIFTARRAFLAVIATFVGLGFVGLLGLLLLIVFVALLLGGKLPGFHSSHAPSSVYAETFAAWLVLFLGLNIASGLWLGAETAVASGWLTLVGSLLAVGWPMLRGVSWQRLRQDLGWTAGRGIVREVLAGIGGYAMAIPLVTLALIVTFLVVGATTDGLQPDKTPAHPIVGWIAQANWWQRVQLVLLACVIAPVVEETMFRGFLYRHLREVTGRWSRWSSVLSAGVLSGVLFALLHPQGLLAVPALVGIALALAFIREWRDTLLPSVIAHGLNNTVVMVLLLVLLGS